MTRAEPTGWLFELRYHSDYWSAPQFSLDKPLMPPEDIRNVRPLYSATALLAAEARAEKAEAERDEAGDKALDQFSRDYHAAYGCDPVMMATGRANWRAAADAAEAELLRVKGRLANVEANAALRLERLIEANDALGEAFETCAKIAERDADWSAFQRASKPDWKTGDETNIYAAPREPDHTMPSDANVFAYRIGIASGRAIAAAIRAARPANGGETP